MNSCTASSTSYRMWRVIHTLPHVCRTYTVALWQETTRQQRNYKRTWRTDRNYSGNWIMQIQYVGHCTINFSTYICHRDVALNGSILHCQAVQFEGPFWYCPLNCTYASQFKNTVHSYCLHLPHTLQWLVPLFRYTPTKDNVQVYTVLTQLYCQRYIYINIPLFRYTPTKDKHCASVYCLNIIVLSDIYIYFFSTIQEYSY